MRRKLKVFVIYFPVMLVSAQVLVNLFSFIDYGAYVKFGFVLNTLFGVNLFFALFLLAFTYWFKFCAVSRYAAWAEILFAANYLIVQEDSLYNVLFQVIVGTAAIALTFRYFIVRFPLCKVALLWSFLTSIATKGSCTKGLELWEQKTYSKIKATYDEYRH